MNNVMDRPAVATKTKAQAFVYRTIVIDGQTIRTAVRPGISEIPPLLIFNGLGASMDLLIPFVAALDPDLEVITFDVPGIGGSSIPSSAYTFSSLAKTITHMLDAMGYAKVSVLGLSWGGFLAQQFAHDHPKRCSKLILAATSAGMWSIYPSAKVLRLMSSPRRYTDPAYGASIAPDIYGGSFRDNPDLCTAHFSRMKPAAPGRGYDLQISAVCGWSSLHLLWNIRQPTLVLAGNDDPVIPLTNMRVLAAHIPSAELVVVDDGHLFLVTKAKEIAPKIMKFLA